MSSEHTSSAGIRSSSSDIYADDSALIAKIEAELMKSAKGSERFRQQIPLLLRKAIDEVIDAPRTGRFTIDEVEKTEKTYLGTKVEIFLRSWFRLPKGRILDLSIRWDRSRYQKHDGKQLDDPRRGSRAPVHIGEDGREAFSVLLWHFS